MTGDALMMVLRTFGRGGVTVEQLRHATNAGAEDLDIGLKVLRQSNRVVIFDRHVIIPDYTPRTRIDSAQVTPYEGAPAIPPDHRRCYSCRQIKHEDESYGNGYCIECGKRTSAQYHSTLTVRKTGESHEAQDDAA